MVLTSGHFENVDGVGVAIGKTGPAQNHVGLLYQTDNEPRFLHLAWHYRLQNDDPYDGDWNSYLWADINLEDEENRSALSAFIESVWQNDQRGISYGFSYTGSAFNADGTFVKPPVGQGLTCATFVVHILSAAGFSLLDMATWKDRAGDAEWRDKIIGWLKRTPGVSAEHVEAISKDTNAMRVRPEDVVAAATSTPWPVSFNDVSLAVEQVLAELEEKFPFDGGDQ